MKPFWKKPGKKKSKKAFQINSESKVEDTA